MRRMEIKEMPREAVDTSLRLLRAPIDAAESLVRPGERAPWVPTMLFDRFDASVRAVAGRLLHDDELRHQAERVRAAMFERERAWRLRSVARAERSRVVGAAESRVADGRDRVHDVDVATHEALDHVDNAHDAQVDRVETKARSRLSAAAEQAATAKRTARRDAPRARERQAEAEQRALGTKQAAVAAKKRAGATADSAASAKAARKRNP